MLSDCVACPRLAAHLAAWRLARPGDHARPVPTAGPADAPLGLVGLAPGPHGANRTGIPFVGDPSGATLRGSLARVGADRVWVTNVVRCLPPRNRPTAGERRACAERWLRPELEAAPARVLVALGAVAWTELHRLAGARAPGFTHGARSTVRLGGHDRAVHACFHPSPLNTRTGRLDDAGLDRVLVAAWEAAC